MKIPVLMLADFIVVVLIMQDKLVVVAGGL